MKTAAAFRHAGFEVRQCSHYVDPDTGKSREIDVLARDPDFLGIVDIQFAVECKASKKPWVLYVPQRHSTAIIDCLLSRRCLTIVVTSLQSTS